MLFPFQEYMNKAREFERHAKAANLEREQTDLQLQVSSIKCDQFCMSYAIYLFKMVVATKTDY